MDLASGDPDTAALSAWLANHDEACPVCAYALNGVASACCPECGSEIRLGVRAPNAIAGPWVLALIGFALAVGFDAVTAMLMGMPLVATAGEDPIVVFVWITLASLGLVSVAGLVWVLMRRRWWMRLAPGRQWKLAWALFLGVGFLHAIAGAVIVWTLVS